MELTALGAGGSDSDRRLLLAQRDWAGTRVSVPGARGQEKEAHAGEGLPQLRAQEGAVSSGPLSVLKGALEPWGRKVGGWIRPRQQAVGPLGWLRFGNDFISLPVFVNLDAETSRCQEAN